MRVRYPSIVLAAFLVCLFLAACSGHGARYPAPTDSVCHPDQLMLAASRYGSTASTPMVWVYAPNDSFFGPTLAADMLDAFKIAGAHAELFRAGSYGADGHLLFDGQGGSRIWGPPVEAYLAAREASP